MREMGALGWGKPETEREERRNSPRRKETVPTAKQRGDVRVIERERWVL